MFEQGFWYHGGQKVNDNPWNNENTVKHIFLVIKYALLWMLKEATPIYFSMLENQKKERKKHLEAYCFPAV